MGFINSARLWTSKALIIIGLLMIVIVGVNNGVIGVDLSAQSKNNLMPFRTALVSLFLSVLFSYIYLNISKNYHY